MSSGRVKSLPPNHQISDNHLKLPPDHVTLQKQAETYNTALKMTAVMVVRLLELSQIIETIRKITHIPNEQEPLKSSPSLKCTETLRLVLASFL